MKITILGCGSSTGIPVLKVGWGSCNPKNKKNIRTRSSILIKTETTSLLIDMSPDLRQQFLFCNESSVDAVLITHAHFDHINGINELRPSFFHSDKQLQIYASRETILQITKMFDYLFHSKNTNTLYKPYLQMNEITKSFTIGDISGICFEQDHGYSKSMGFRIGNFAYSTDIVKMTEENFRLLEGIDTFVVACLSLTQNHPTHANLKTVLQWINRIKPKQTILTHMGIDMDYDSLLKILPKNICPAYDQMIFEC